MNDIKFRSRYLSDRMSDAEYINYLEEVVHDLELQLKEEKRRFNQRIADEFESTQKEMGTILSLVLSKGKIE